MQFLFNENSGLSSLLIEGEQYKYIFKVRRHAVEQNLFFRNLKNKKIYEYKVDSLDRRKAVLSLVSSEEKIIEAKKKLHIGWCVIDPKSVEKVLASLNEIGVEKITFIYCKYSQSKYKINEEKLQKLLLNSSGQCGRSSVIEIEHCSSLKEFLEQNPQSYMFNFSKNHILSKKDEIDTIVIGCEGGFESEEVALFDEEKIVGVDSDIILRSETAAAAAAAAVLL